MVRVRQWMVRDPQWMVTAPQWMVRAPQWMVRAPYLRGLEVGGDHGRHLQLREAPASKAVGGGGSPRDEDGLAEDSHPLLLLQPPFHHRLAELVGHEVHTDTVAQG
eukprot:4816067-Pyramimonas_sp.AAC.1